MNDVFVLDIPFECWKVKTDICKPTSAFNLTRLNGLNKCLKYRAPLWELKLLRWLCKIWLNVLGLNQTVNRIGHRYEVFIVLAFNISHSVALVIQQITRFTFSFLRCTFDGSNNSTETCKCASVVCSIWFIRDGGALPPLQLVSNGFIGSFGYNSEY